MRVLANCRYGVVILSKCFFGKHYPEKELNGLDQREVGGQSVILPIWYGIDAEDVRAVSPTLADKIGGKWEQGIYKVTLDLLEVIRPDIISDLQKDKLTGVNLPRIRTGSELGEILTAGDSARFLNDDPEPKEVALIVQFLDELHSWGELLDVNGPGRQVEAIADLQHYLEELGVKGWSVFGNARNRIIQICGKGYTLGERL